MAKAGNKNLKKKQKIHTYKIKKQKEENYSFSVFFFLLHNQ